MKDESSVEITLTVVAGLYDLDEVIQFLFPAIVLTNYEEILKPSFLRPHDIHVD